ncbi:MAG: hypothetical protein ASARMPREDX12_007681 [Alectoria sarmentosa]|nr:MAG: hypothetical protein ASARMPREDX12_007681 [Alectoria sarmentosa]
MGVDLPLLDFSKFLHGNPTERLEVAEQIADCFTRHGFIKLKNHGVSDDIVQGIWKWGKLFFNMTTEQKMKIIHHPGPDPQRGWSQKGAETTSKLRKENADGAPRGELLDEKEHFDCGPPGDEQFPNIYPEDDLPGYKEFVENYFTAAQQACLEIMSACEVGLHIPEGTLLNSCIPAASELRMLHYPAVSIETLEKGLIKRAWPHTDFGIITLLFQDALGGLELEDRSDPFHFVPVITESSNEMVVNISDTFNRWSNGTIKAGLHQVNVPPVMRGSTQGSVPERYSSVFFFKAHREASVGPLKEFVNSERPAQYSDINALEFHREMTDILY